ncbi:MAG: hypothetical protein PHD22_01695 [Zoogloea sp.]|nr:hypothetical protein [Zoogloea sp.]MDD3352352.1 hypothetical protein [Zoogloea sp.]
MGPRFKMAQGGKGVQGIPEGAAGSLLLSQDRRGTQAFRQVCHVGAGESYHLWVVDRPGHGIEGAHGDGGRCAAGAGFDGLACGEACFTLAVVRADPAFGNHDPGCVLTGGDGEFGAIDESIDEGGDDSEALAEAADHMNDTPGQLHCPCVGAVGKGQGGVLVQAHQYVLSQHHCCPAGATDGNLIARTEGLTQGGRLPAGAAGRTNLNPPLCGCQPADRELAGQGVPGQGGEQGCQGQGAEGRRVWGHERLDGRWFARAGTGAPILAFVASEQNHSNR